ncbi:MAG: sulfurtransferase complex subunit TusD [Proteobacteria bacterium]|jgi:tRNA 2-thiouridine synthesizing protein D|nr:sulfurtransferase complex subunit TusD [Pseudomonadota bacterium]MDA1302359.1 sulfurtransferase complex subunit TusD [Pseudomonadota bacterium]
MKFAIVVYGAPYSDQASRSAYLFTRAVLDEGHDVYRVFFYHDGVYAANRLTVAPQDEADIQQDWSKLGAVHGLDLVICIASALRRGMLDETEARRYEREGVSVDPRFTISGLGQLVDAALNADQVMTFGA